MKSSKGFLYGLVDSFLFGIVVNVAGAVLLGMDDFLQADYFDLEEACDNIST